MQQPSAGCRDSLLGAKRADSLQGQGRWLSGGRGRCRERLLLKGRTLCSLQTGTNVCVSRAKPSAGDAGGPRMAMMGCCRVKWGGASSAGACEGQSQARAAIGAVAWQQVCRDS